MDVRVRSRYPLARTWPSISVKFREQDGPVLSNAESFSPFGHTW